MQFIRHRLQQLRIAPSGRRDGLIGLIWYHLRESLVTLFNFEGQRTAIVRKYQFRLLRNMVPFVGVRGQSGIFFISTSDDVIGSETYRDRGFNEKTLEDAVAVAQAAGFEISGTTFVDIGANVGVTTIPALTRMNFGSVFAAEPEPTNYKLLMAAVAANGLLGRVVGFPGGVSDTDGLLPLELSSDNSGDHRIRMGDTAGSFSEQNRDTISVDVRTLSSFDLSALPEVGLLWIDVQGHESHVLAGAGALLGAVPTVVEYWPYGLQRAGGLDRFHKLVAENFDKVHDLGTGSLIDASVVASMAGAYDGTRHTDLLLLPHRAG